MPTSITPPPADDEVECGNCGKYFYYELTRCPHCGVNVYEPGEEPDRPGRDPSRTSIPPRSKIGVRLEGFVRRLTKKPYPADELFGAAINQAGLFDDLLAKVGGDRAAAERLVEFERAQYPLGNRLAWIERAIQRWERDNRAPGPAR
jgi:hypothetical protein